MFDTRATGEKTIDLEKLRSITSYNVEDNNPIVSRFWNALEKMTDDERASYLKFVWGRNRLPASLENLSYNHRINVSNELDCQAYPRANTCFFILELPVYESDEICYKKLVQACALCGAIDTDGTATEDLD